MSDSSPNTPSLFSRHPVVSTLLIMVMIDVPALGVAVILGVPWRIGVIVTVGASVVSCYGAYRIVNYPDDPGRFVRLVQRLGGE